eukprot:CAMPEP_0169434768 /NCGR_PEP_ID=MMETSP1042-20121227/4708_1 /TAXON_ID=464988 /ORGANISM="Hemiselmis andersenii, Strain CCMP1180" /LENGTH=106 /DNA_ID=CAMNT_0009545371 /DNA_START=185 /DNA_END=501 /DNA_ORIENTATION=+
MEEQRSRFERMDIDDDQHGSEEQDGDLSPRPAFRQTSPAAHSSGSSSCGEQSGGDGDGDDGPEDKRDWAKRMLERTGWKQGQGLGVDRGGRAAPLRAVVRLDRTCV